LELACDNATDVKACLEQKKEEQLQEVVEDILTDALGEPVDLGGGLP
jgi:hypothetical protein